MQCQNGLTISVFGMGYVGCVSAACLAEAGHQVIGIDVAEIKLKAIAEGRPPVEEAGLAEMIAKTVLNGQLRVSRDVHEAVKESTISLICVGTPSQPNGAIDLSNVQRVCEQIGEALAVRQPGHVVVLRSTVVPGTMDLMVRPVLEQFSGKREGDHFFVAFNPEFLREGSAVADFLKPPAIVVGSSSPYALDLVKRLYGAVPAPLVSTTPRIAEMLKYLNNAWHALKITFANEIGELCRQAGVDSHNLIEIFLQDRQLNISPAYLRPGFAFGGSCLPKDLKALLHFAKHRDITLPLLEQILPSNTLQIERVFHRILEST